MNIAEKIDSIINKEPTIPYREKINIEVTFGKYAEEWDLVVYFHYIPPIPGKISGPPELCYPPEEEEYDILLVVLLDSNGKEYKILEIPSEAFYNAIVDKLKLIE